MAPKTPHIGFGRYSSNILGLGAMILAVMAWAIAANVANSLFLSGVMPFELAGVSITIAAFGLLILNCLIRSHTQQLNRTELVLGIILAGLMGTSYLAVQRLPVAVATVLLFIAPSLVILWNIFVSRHPPSRSILVALGLSIVGVLLVSNIFVSKVESIDWFGILIGLSTAMFFAAYTILLEKASANRETIGVMLNIFAVASLVWIGYQLTQGIPHTLMISQNIWKVVGMGLVGNLLPNLLFLWSIQKIQAERAAIAATLEPLFAGILAWIWFGQTLSLLQIFGGFLIIVAITWMQLQPIG